MKEITFFTGLYRFLYFFILILLLVHAQIAKTEPMFVIIALLIITRIELLQLEIQKRLE